MILNIIYLLITFLIINGCVYLFYFLLIFLLPKKEDKVVNQKQFEYVILVPCMNEERVIMKTMLALKSLPESNRSQIFVIDDDSSDKTSIEVEAFARENKNFHLIQRKLPQAQQGKGESLNYGYKKVVEMLKSQNKDLSNIIMGIVDADGRMSENVYKELDRAFTDDSIGAAQSRVRMTNYHHILARLQDLEFFSVISHIQNSRQYSASACLGGNGQFSRISAMETVVARRGFPWTACLSEDFEFGLQLALEGWNTRHLHNVVVYQQALTDYKKLIKQRSRWAQGNIQCRIYTKDILVSENLPVSAKIDLMYFMVQAFLNVTVFFVVIILMILTVVYFVMNGFGGVRWDYFYTSIIYTFIPSSLLVADYYFATKNSKIGTCKLTELPMLIILNAFYSVILLPSLLYAFYREYILKSGAWIKTERSFEK
jgi:1,2-diacylglycerol 3-beta-glucosyltransferase